MKDANLFFPSKLPTRRKVSHPMRHGLFFRALPVFRPGHCMHGDGRARLDPLVNMPPGQNLFPFPRLNCVFGVFCVSCGLNLQVGPKRPLTFSHCDAGPCLDETTEFFQEIDLTLPTSTIGTCSTRFHECTDPPLRPCRCCFVNAEAPPKFSLITQDASPDFYTPDRSLPPPFNEISLVPPSSPIPMRGLSKRTDIFVDNHAAHCDLIQQLFLSV